MKHLLFTFSIVWISLLTLSCGGDNTIEVKEIREGKQQEEEKEPEVPVPTELEQLVADMGIGINLGNSLDTKSRDKTLWGNPLPTKAMIDKMAERGFKTLRLPVTWRFNMGEAPTYTIENDYLDRVQEVVDWGLENDMYVVLNIHHDDEWIIPTDAKADQVSDQIGKVWKQIALQFKNYNKRLIFETINEPRHEGTPKEWLGGTEEGRRNVNLFHKASVDAIRATGGNNSDRYLMVCSYAASTTDVAINNFVIPNDDPNIIVSLHMYSPWHFCLAELENGGRSTWGTDQDYKNLTAEFEHIDKHFKELGRPIVIGEWSSALRENNEEDRLRHAEHYLKEATKRGMATILWDTDNNHGVFDRNNVTWRETQISFVDKIFETYEMHKETSEE